MADGDAPNEESPRNALSKSPFFGSMPDYLIRDTLNLFSTRDQASLRLTCRHFYDHLSGVRPRLTDVLKINQWDIISGEVASPEALSFHRNQNSLFRLAGDNVDRVFKGADFNLVEISHNFTDSWLSAMGGLRFKAATCRLTQVHIAPPPVMEPPGEVEGPPGPMAEPALPVEPAGPAAIIRFLQPGRFLQPHGPDILLEHRVRVRMRRALEAERRAGGAAVDGRGHARGMWPVRLEMRGQPQNGEPPAENEAERAEDNAWGQIARRLELDLLLARRPAQQSVEQKIEVFIGHLESMELDFIEMDRTCNERLVNAVVKKWSYKVREMHVKDWLFEPELLWSMPLRKVEIGDLICSQPEHIFNRIILDWLARKRVIGEWEVTFPHHIATCLLFSGIPDESISNMGNGVYFLKRVFFEMSVRIQGLTLFLEEDATGEMFEERLAPRLRLNSEWDEDSEGEHSILDMSDGDY